MSDPTTMAETFLSLSGPDKGRGVLGGLPPGLSADVFGLALEVFLARMKDMLECADFLSNQDATERFRELCRCVYFCV